MRSSPEIRRNTVIGVAGWGISAVVDGCSIVGNMVQEAGYDGILVAGIGGGNSSCDITDNVAVNNGFYGLRVDSDGNKIDNNVLNGNADYGLFFNTGADANSYQGNIIVDNTDRCIQDLGTGNAALGANLLAGSPAGCP